MEQGGCEKKPPSHCEQRKKLLIKSYATIKDNYISNIIRCSSPNNKKFDETFTYHLSWIHRDRRTGKWACAQTDKWYENLTTFKHQTSMLEEVLIVESLHR